MSLRVSIVSAFIACAWCGLAPCASRAEGLEAKRAGYQVPGAIVTAKHTDQDYKEALLRVYIDIHINNKKFRALMDTGYAGGVILSKYSFSSGYETVEIAGHVYEHVYVVERARTPKVDEFGAEAIIGLSLIKKFGRISLDLTSGKIYIGDAVRTKPVWRDVYNLIDDGDRLALNVMISGRHESVLFDTGMMNPFISTDQKHCGDIIPSGELAVVSLYGRTALPSAECTFKYGSSSDSYQAKALLVNRSDYLNIFGEKGGDPTLSSYGIIAGLGFIEGYDVVEIDLIDFELKLGEN